MFNISHLKIRKILNIISLLTLFMISGCTVFKQNYNKEDVPLIMQQDPRECGLAVLSMMFSYFGKNITIDQIYSDLNIDTTYGMTAKTMIEISNYYGFNMNGYKCDVENLRDIEFPIIIHWNYNHFVVLTDLTKDKAFINDPACGRREVNMDEFKDSFTGVILCIEMDSP